MSPWGTFFVNVTGSFLRGIVLVIVEGGTLPAEARLFLAVGILGGYTTFSSSSYETLQLLNGGDVAPVLFNTLGQLLIGLLAVCLGVVLLELSEESDGTRRCDEVDHLRRRLFPVRAQEALLEGIAGATVLHGIEGYGADKQIHTARILDLSGDLPVVIIAIDRTEKIEAVMPKLDAMIDKGLVTTEEVRVLFSRPKPIG
jgi:protein CrcB